MSDVLLGDAKAHAVCGTDQTKMGEKAALALAEILTSLPKLKDLQLYGECCAARVMIIRHCS